LRADAPPAPERATPGGWSARAVPGEPGRAARAAVRPAARPGRGGPARRRVPAARFGRRRL